MGPKIGFMRLLKNVIINFICIWSLIEVFILLYKFHILEKSGSWDISQKNLIIACWYKFLKS